MDQTPDGHHDGAEDVLCPDEAVQHLGLGPVEPGVKGRSPPEPEDLVEPVVLEEPDVPHQVEDGLLAEPFANGGELGLGPVPAVIDQTVWSDGVVLLVPVLTGYYHQVERGGLGRAVAEEYLYPGAVTVPAWFGETVAVNPGWSGQQQQQRCVTYVA